jgi:DNA-directed RNA polymerase subunit omega
MGRLTSETASRAIGSKYDLVLVAARRIRELRNGHAPLIQSRDSDISIAMDEIEQGLVGKDYLLKNPNLESEGKRRAK